MGANQNTRGGWQAIAVRLMIEQPASRMGMDRLIQRLEKSGYSLDQRLNKLNAEPRNQERIAHIISIELWGQRRLAFALGEPPIRDESDLYRPDRTGWDDLRETFRAARQSTIRLAKSLRMAGVDPSVQIEHNQFGPLSVLGWIYYLDLHARFESLWFN